MFNKLRADMKHYENAGGWYRSLGFWVTATYRFGSWAHHSIENKPLQFVALVAHKTAATPWRFFKSVGIPAKADIGEGFCLHHPWNINIPPPTRIGKNCTIYQEVTLGHGPVPGFPTIGDNVRIYAGAKILGGITIGDNVEIGANAVVTRDVPSGSVVSAPPARAIPRDTADKLKQNRDA